jgi:hypothetical protein
MVLDATASSMTGVLEIATEVLTWMLTSAGSILTFMTSNPIILLFVIVALVFIAVGLVRKFI